MASLILRVDVTGQPMRWIPWQDAAVLYARDKVAWTTGEDVIMLRGGTNRLTGLRSTLVIRSIIASRGIVNSKRFEVVPPLSNRELFRRDGHMCLYCLNTFSESHLTRDHIIPVSRGGSNTWTNVVTACRSCNQRKGARSPEEAGMRLFAIPYAPNYAEWLALRNRRILADQMAFLKTQFRAKRSVTDRRTQ